MALLNSLIPVVEVQSLGTATFACQGVRENGIAAGKFGSGLTPPPPDGSIPPPHPLGFVMVDIQEDMDLIDWDILIVVNLGMQKSLLYINKVNLKDTQCRYLLQ